METQEQQIEQTPLADTQDGKPDPKVEAEARELGWVPEAEWKGDPPKNGFKSPEDFVQRGKEVLPIVNKRLRDELTKKDDEIARIKKDGEDRFSRLERMSQAALTQQRAKLESEFSARKEAAVETGDKEAYRTAVKEEKDTLAEFDKSSAPEATEGDKGKKFDIPPETKRTVEAWVADNAWFKTDEEMNAVANARHAKLLKERPGLTLKENLDEVGAYVKKRFPEKFADDDPDDGDDPPARRGSPVESGSRLNGGNGKSAWSQIPADAKTQADRYIKDDKLFLEDGETVEKNLQQARERYARQYLES